MAITATTVWEIRTTGLNTNGGGYDNLSPGVSVDYSQQDAPILTRSDFQKGTGANDITTAAGVACFTQAMIGNIICVTTASVIKFFQITAVSGDFKTITVDAAVGAFTGKTGSVGGAYKLGGANDTIFDDGASKSAGNVIHIKAGTYTLTATLSFPTTSLVFLGYNAARNDNPTGANRPVIDGATFQFGVTGSPLTLKHLIFTGLGLATPQLNLGSVFVYNCKFINTYTAGTDRITVQVNESGSSGSHSVFCEFSSAKGISLNLIGSANAFPTISTRNCYFHGGNCGMTLSGPIVIRDCVFAEHSIVGAAAPAGIRFSSTSAINISGCIFYAETTGIQNITNLSSGATIVNNIFDVCATGLSWYLGGDSSQNYINYNCYHCTVADSVNMAKGPDDITADPLFVDPANADFRYTLGSPCFNTGMQVGSIVGL